MTITAETLRPGQQILVQGKLTFGKLSQQYQGAELERRITQQKQNGSFYPTDVPHTTVNIADAKVLFKDGTNPTIEEQFVQGKTYEIKSGDNQGKIGFGIDDKGKFLPAVFEKNSETGKYAPVTLERELASGLDVILVLETYAPKGGYAKKGLGLSQVLINEPLKYYGGGASVEALAERGIVFEAPAVRVEATAGAAAPAEGQGYQGEALPANTQIDQSSGLAMPSPGVAPAPAAAPVATTTVAPIPTPAPAAPAAPVDDKDAQIAALMAQLEAKNATPAGGSAFDQEPAAAAPAAAGQPNPWGPA